MPGGLKNYYFLCENRHEASFYIKEQTHQKLKKLITIKNDILAVLVVNHSKIKKITPPYCVLGLWACRMGGRGYQSYICVAWEWYGGMWWAHCPAGTWNSTQMSRHSTNETPHSENFRHVVNKNWIYWAKRFVYL